MLIPIKPTVHIAIQMQCLYTSYYPLISSLPSSLFLHLPKRLCPCHAPTIATNQILSTINKREYAFHSNSNPHSFTYSFTTFTTAQTELSAKYQQLFRLVSHYAPKPRLPRPSLRPPLPLSALDWHRLFDFRLANSPQKKRPAKEQPNWRLLLVSCLHAHTHTDTPSHTRTPCHTHTQQRA